MNIQSELLALLIVVVSFGSSFWTFRLAIPLLRKRGIVGRDVHKPNHPEVPEMGGLLLVSGFAAGILTTVGANTFLERFLSVRLDEMLAVLCVVLLAALIGTIDDLMRIRQRVKAILPLFIALPLVAVGSGDTTMSVPFLGSVDFDLVYTIVFVPLGVAGAANAVNMLAGFNGMETGVGLVAIVSLAVIAFRLEETASFLVLIAASGALLATLYYNRYPAKIFIGDSGTLAIGAIIASAVIIGNFEVAGLIVMIPYFVDFSIKVRHRFPSTVATHPAPYNAGRLHCPASGPKGLTHLILKPTGGMREGNATLVLMGLEAVCGIVAILLFL